MDEKTLYRKTETLMFAAFLNHLHPWVLKPGLQTSSRWPVEHNGNKLNLLLHINSAASFLQVSRQCVVSTVSLKNSREHRYAECFYILSVMKQHWISGKNAHCALMMAVISLCSCSCRGHCLHRSTSNSLKASETVASNCYVLFFSPSFILIVK